MPIYVGMMSGTSADGIDAVAVDLDGHRITQHLGHSFTPLTAELKKSIIELYTPGDDEIDRLGELDCKLGELFAEACMGLLGRCGINSGEVVAIGSHGQTVRHRPRHAKPFTLQIGDPNTIATLTGITTVADFRRRDMANGGQGAPLAPAFHQALFGHQESNCGVLNLGGIANITVLHEGELITGYDIGPANGLMDYWVDKTLQLAFDNNGDWARTGQVDSSLLNRLLAHPYFQLPTPRSTGREEFSGAWLETILQGCHSAPVDVQATLLEFTASTISQEISKWQIDKIFLCGGGARNLALCERLQALQPKIKWQSTAALGLDPQLVEATAFAWLAQQTIHRASGNHPAATGADRFTILGGVYWGGG